HSPANSLVVPCVAAALPGAPILPLVRDGPGAAVSHAEQPWLAAASAATGRRGRGGQLHGPGARWWVEAERRAEFALVPDIVRSAWCWRRFTEAALDGTGRLAAGGAGRGRGEAVGSGAAGHRRPRAAFPGRPAG